MDNSIFHRLAFWRKHSNATGLGMYVAPDAVWVHQPATADKEAVEMEFRLAGNNWAGVFSKIAEAFGHNRFQLVLSAAWYQLLQVDKPPVEPQEMPQALLWAVKDMVNVPVANIHLDYFDAPLASQNKVTVAVVDKSQLKQLVLAAVECHCDISGISIEEMAVCNLHPNDPQARLVISHYPGQDLLFTVVRDGEPCMQRRVRGFGELDTITAQDLSYGAADNLSLELQRSMDYFESQLRQPPVTAIDILVGGASDTLAQLVGANFNQAVTSIPKSSVGIAMATLAYTEMNREESA